MSLRDDLARRLQRVGLPKSVWTGSFDHWEWLADECIRQMEWARAAYSAGYHSSDRVEAINDPLTLAPDHWTP